MNRTLPSQILPVRPEAIADSYMVELVPHFVEKINTYMNTNTQFSANGPWCCIPVECVIYDTLNKLADKYLINKVVEEITHMYEQYGWAVWHDIQLSGSQYLTFTSHIWKKDSSSE